MSGNRSSVLIAPERNNFFYGKLMDVREFERDYAYALQKRHLLNRFVVGSGVLVGLNIAPDTTTPGNVLLLAGAALDALGREIIVADQVSIDPHQPTDDQGKPAGNPLQNGTVIIGLVYAEKKTDMVPKLVADCSGNEKCDWNTVREGYHVVVRQTNDAAPAAPSCGLTGGFPLRAPDALQKALAQRINAPAAVDPTDLVIPLASVDLPKLQAIDNSVRPLVYGNRVLYELILCLSDRVASVAGAWILRYVSGDGQSATAKSKLDKPLVVQLVDGSGHPVPNQTVQFQPAPGNGKAVPATITTDKDGTAYVIWTVGSQGPQQLIASAAGSAFTVTFNATLK